jgi:hypothetical protein
LRATGADEVRPKISACREPEAQGRRRSSVPRPNRVGYVGVAKEENLRSVDGVSETIPRATAYAGVSAPPADLN